MQLIGSFLSPFVRRVAVTMKLYGLPFEHHPYATDRDGADIGRFNPLGRVPALVLDDGEVIVDSGMIIDHLDDVVGPERALTPRAGADRQHVNRIVALATGVSDKYVAAYYERTKRPASHVWKPWLGHLEDQVHRGLQALDGMVQGPWFVGAALSQADVSTIVAVQAMRHDMPHLAPQGQFRALDGLVRAAAPVDAFASTLPGQ